MKDIVWDIRYYRKNGEDMFAHIFWMATVLDANGNKYIIYLDGSTYSGSFPESQYGKYIHPKDYKPKEKWSKEINSLTLTITVRGQNANPNIVGKKLNDFGNGRYISLDWFKKLVLPSTISTNNLNEVKKFRDVLENMQKQLDNLLECLIKNF